MPLEARKPSEVRTLPALNDLLHEEVLVLGSKHHRGSAPLHIRCQKWAFPGSDPMPDADNFPRRTGFHYGSGMSTEKSTGFRFGVLPRIVVAIALGILLGSLLPTWATRIFVTLQRHLRPVPELLHPADHCRLDHPGHRGVGARSR